ncbi:MAG: sigma-70 family RNA polymerase sigma factor, partial [Nitrospirota bacterium]
MGDRSKDTPAVSEPEVLDDDVVVEEVDESAFTLPETPEVLPAAGKDTALAPYDPLHRYLAEVRRYPFLTKEEELHLFNDFQVTGNRESAVKLIVSNLRVAVTIAAEYLHSGADYLDLIQEGNVGLMQAIKKFDPAKGSRFHSYAAWWVRAYI